MSAPDVLVLGSGIVGLATARELRRLGLRVEVLESRAPLGGASGASAGILSPFADRGSATDDFRRLCVAARDGWPDWLRELEEESGLGVELDRSGSLALDLDSQAGEGLAELAAACVSVGEPLETVSGDRLFDKLPALRDGAHQALHLPREMRVHPVQVCQALLVALGREGVAITTATPTRRIEMLGSGVRVHLPEGHRDSAWLVVATGAWSTSIEGLPALPITPVRGQIVLLDDVDSATWPFGGAVRGAHRGEHRYAVRRGARGLIVGSTLERSGFAEYPTVAGIGGLIDYVRDVYSALGGARLVSTWAGLRPGSPDGRPIVGPIDSAGPAEVSPTLLAAGHYRNGVLLAPWTAARIAEAIAAGGRVSPDWAYGLDRFASAEVSAGTPL